jgi:hypothetical protein
VPRFQPLKDLCQFSLFYASSSARTQEGDGVLALPMAAAASTAPVGGGGSGSARPRGMLPPDALAAAPGWRTVLQPARGQDCLQADHWRGATFALLVDDSDSPDGRIELVTVPASPGESASDGPAPGLRRQVLVGGFGSSRRGAAAAEAAAALEVNEFALARRHAAVTIRRNGVCVVLAYDLEAASREAPDVPDSGSGDSCGSGSGSESDSARRGSNSGSDLRLPSSSWELSFGANSTAVIGVSPGCDFDSPIIRLSLQSFVAPRRVEALDLSSKGGARASEARAVIYEERLAPGFDAGRYQSQLEWATSHDGVKVGASPAWGLLAS